MKNKIKNGPRVPTPEERREHVLKQPVRTNDEALAQMQRLRDFRIQEEMKREAKQDARS